MKNDVLQQTGEYTHRVKVNSQTCKISARVKKRDSTHMDFKSFYCHAHVKYDVDNLSVSISASIPGEIGVAIIYTPQKKKVTKDYVQDTNVTLNLDKYLC